MKSLTTRQKVIVAASGSVLTIAVAAGVVALTPTTVVSAETPSAQNSSSAPVSATLSVPVPTAQQLAAAPEARYDAVIPGLIPYASVSVAVASQTAYQLAADTAVYGADMRTIVARLPAKNFLELPTVVVPVKTVGDWQLVMTPARNALPSANNNFAPAQTAGWVQNSALTQPVALTQHVVISTSAQTLSIVNDDGSVVVSYPVGVGTATTPSPKGVTGYLQARYLDPAQGQARYPIQLTSLHLAVADNPVGGSDGGLIGIHFDTTTTGAVSHGCIRVSAEAINAVNQLPLGTSISIEA